MKHGAAASGYGSGATEGHTQTAPADGQEPAAVEVPLPDELACSNLLQRSDPAMGLLTKASVHFSWARAKLAADASHVKAANRNDMVSRFLFIQK